MFWHRRSAQPPLAYMPPAGAFGVTAGRSRSRTASARSATSRLPVRGIMPASGATTTRVARMSSSTCDDILEGQVTQSAWHVYRRGVDFGKQRIPPCGAQRDHRGIRRALSQREQMIVRVLEVLKSWIWPFAILASGSLQRQHPELGVHRGCTIGLPKEPAIPPNDTGHWGRW